MPVCLLTTADSATALGDMWTITVLVTDADGDATDAAVPVVTVTLPDASTVVPAVERVTGGVYRAAHTLAAAGRYTARIVSTGYGAADAATYVNAPRSGTGIPTAQQFRDYATEDFGNYEDDEIESTIATEAQAQRGVCRVGAVIPDDLWEALLRRVRVNLSRRTQPVLVTVDSDGTNTFLPSRDPEVRRLEGPYRKMVMG